MILVILSGGSVIFLFVSCRTNTHGERSLSTLLNDSVLFPILSQLFTYIVNGLLLYLFLLLCFNDLLLFLMCFLSPLPELFIETFSPPQEGENPPDLSRVAS